MPNYWNDRIDLVKLVSTGKKDELLLERKLAVGPTPVGVMNGGNVTSVPVSALIAV